jgi:hypothetical protein
VAETVAGHTTLPGLQVSAYGSVYSDLKTYTLALSDASTVAATTAPERTYTVTGLKVDDKVISVTSGDAWATNLGVGGFRVSAANTLAIQWINPTAGAIAPGTHTLTVIVLNTARA